MYLNLNISNVGRGRKFEAILLFVLYVERERERERERGLYLGVRNPKMVIGKRYVQIVEDRHRRRDKGQNLANVFCWIFEKK
jgi:hypothetical protein